MRAGLLIAFALVSAGFAGTAAAQESSASSPHESAAPSADMVNALMPSTLIIGYDGEGAVDTSEEACRSFVTQTVEWEEAEVDKAVKDVCAYRVRHAEEYAALQAAYKAFAAVLMEQTRFDGTAAASDLSAMLRSCIDHKSALTTGGHNVAVDMVPNGIAAQCLRLGTDLLTAETQQLQGD
jgi:hypothetical protein